MMTLAYALTTLILALMMGWCLARDRLSAPAFLTARRYRFLSYACLFAFIVWSAAAVKYHTELVTLIRGCHP